MRRREIVVTMAIAIVAVWALTALASPAMADQQAKADRAATIGRDGSVIMA